MTKHSVWSPCNEPTNFKPLTTTWVFKQRTDEDSNLTKFKSRLCVRGFNQREGIDYDKVVSPTGRLTSFRLLLTLCSRSKFIVEQMDVRCAFLNSTPEKPLYIYRPNGYKENENCNIFKLNRSLYGLKQSHRCWRKALKDVLLKIGLSPCNTDPCFYISTSKNKPMWLFIHVDDLLFGGNWNDEFKYKIKQHFDMEDLGKAKYALGIRITQETNCISLLQDKFID
ncbi:hypothetical protein O181_065577 [Austropuccinia psidii MF-1]|uniref:Reverse transcriptase Ty1/copia-type domain-containing protein n=1 Tax=Austropuccinia psidii MF-1 TaxID=1389203 RepID=A0A9Q3ETR2_9BASI|nr:hypothetical protein [Austropuccinia psidii MF-1]